MGHLLPRSGSEGHRLLCSLQFLHDNSSLKTHIKYIREAYYLVQSCGPFTEKAIGPVIDGAGDGSFTRFTCVCVGMGGGSCYTPALYLFS